MSAEVVEVSRRRSRSKLLLLSGIVLCSGVALIGATQPWVTLRLIDGVAAVDHLQATGQELNASLSPVALAGLASVLALTIAGAAFRRVLGVLVVLLGAGIVAVTAGFLSSPKDAATGRVTELTGLAGGGHAEFITDVTTSFWPLVTLAGGALLAVLGVLVLLLSGRWGAVGRKYEAGGASRRAGSHSDADNMDDGQTANERKPDRISDWDALSDGDDPTQ